MIRYKDYTKELLNFPTQHDISVHFSLECVSLYRFDCCLGHLINSNDMRKKKLVIIHNFFHENIIKFTHKKLFILFYHFPSSPSDNSFFQKKLTFVKALKILLFK